MRLQKGCSNTLGMGEGPHLLVNVSVDGSPPESGIFRFSTIDTRLGVDLNAEGKTLTLVSCSKSRHFFFWRDTTHSQETQLVDLCQLTSDPPRLLRSRLITPRQTLQVAFTEPREQFRDVSY